MSRFLASALVCEICNWQCRQKVLLLFSVKLVCEFKGFSIFLLFFFFFFFCLVFRLGNLFTAWEVLSVFYHVLSMITSNIKVAVSTLMVIAMYQAVQSWTEKYLVRKISQNSLTNIYNGDISIKVADTRLLL